MLNIIDCDFCEFIRQCRNKKVYCFGAGKIFSKFMLAVNGISVCGIIDNDVRKQGMEKEEGEKKIPIFSLQTFLEMDIDDFVIVVTAIKFYEIIEILDNCENLSGVGCYIYTFLSSYTESHDDLKICSKMEQIPQIIHYCWFGKKELPDEYKKNIDSWMRFCPDYKLKRWDESNIDIDSYTYMRQAYERKDWAFVSDVARIIALFKDGGIYLDTDVQLIKKMDDFLGWDFFCGIETGNFVNFGIGYGSVKKHPILQKLLDFYNDILYIDSEGNVNKTSCPIYQSHIMRQYGFKIDGSFEQKDNIAIFPKEVFCPLNPYKGLGKITRNTHSIHWFSASWLDDDIEQRKKVEEDIKKIYERIKRQ